MQRIQQQIFFGMCNQQYCMQIIKQHMSIGLVGQQYLGKLHVASGQSRFYLLGSCGDSQATSLSPHKDPVQMVVNYSRPSPAEQQVLALIPGTIIALLYVTSWAT